MSSELHPIWFLDVDGVINALQWSQPEGYERAQANGFPITWDPRVITAINEIHDRGVVEVRWLTTWGSEANEYLVDLMGINKFEVECEFPGEHVWGEDWWKLRAVQKRHAEGNRKLIWTDDDLAVEKFATTWCQGKNMLWIAPTHYTGLTEANIRTICGFLETPFPRVF